jgi:hypothetical protein
MSLATQGTSETRRRLLPHPAGVRGPSGRGPTIAVVSDREVAAVESSREAEELLQIEEADAWFEYLEATTNQSVQRYAELEPWAWARLRQRLRAIKTRRARLRPAAA